MIFDAELDMKGENISIWTFLGSQTQNIPWIPAVVSELTVTFCDDEYIILVFRTLQHEDLRKVFICHLEKMLMIVLNEI
jgi:hypothetical protein